MPNFDFNVDMFLSAEDNQTRINKKEYRFVDCSKFNIPEECSMWRDEKCGSDEDYCQPYVPGDLVYLQVPIPVTFSNLVAVQVFDTATDMEITPIPFTIQKGQDDNRVTYMNVTIDTTNLTQKCWYVKITMFKCPDLVITEDLTNCIAEGVGLGKTQAQALIDCLLGDPARYNCDIENWVALFSEPYCLVCDYPTIVIEGQYSGYDCDGFYYGPLTFGETELVNAFKLLFRVWGVIEEDQAVPTVSEQNGITQKISLRRNFTLRTEKIPPYVYHMMRRVWGSQAIYVDGVLYTGRQTLDKNFEEGKMWIIKTRLSLDCDDIDVNCVDPVES